jgi:hypothetical protein
MPLELNQPITQDGGDARECDRIFTFNTADKEVQAS